MRLLQQRWLDLSPKIQFWFRLALVLILVPVLYLVRGGSLLPPEVRFRQAEAAEFLGPTQILADIDTGCGDHPKAILASDVHTAAVFLYSWDKDHLYSREREDSFTLICAREITPFVWYQNSGEDLYLPLILFDRHPAAVHAELEITAGEICWHLESTRDGNGCFRFDLVSPGDREAPEDEALARLCALIAWDTPAEIRFTTRFYGAVGTLVAEEVLCFEETQHQP